MKGCVKFFLIIAIAFCAFAIWNRDTFEQSTPAIAAAKASPIKLDRTKTDELGNKIELYYAEGSYTEADILAVLPSQPFSGFTVAYVFKSRDQIKLPVNATGGFLEAEDYGRLIATAEAGANGFKSVKLFENGKPRELLDTETPKR